MATREQIAVGSARFRLGMWCAFLGLTLYGAVSAALDHVWPVAVISGVMSLSFASLIVVGYRNLTRAQRLRPGDPWQEDTQTQRIWWVGLGIAVCALVLVFLLR